MSAPVAGNGRARGDEWQFHAGAAGFGGLNHLTAPLQEFPVKAFFLLEMPSGDLARNWFQAKDVDLEQALRDAGARRVEVWRAELWDPVAVARCLIEGMADEGLSTLHVNVSAGPNTVSVGATLAALFWDVRLYYAKADYSKDPDLRETVEGFPIQGVHRLPPFRADPPRPESLKALTVLVKEAKETSSRTWKDLLTDDHKIIRYKGPDKEKAEKRPSPQAIHGQFEAIVRPLVNLGLVEEHWSYGKRSFTATEQGLAYARLFDGMDHAHVTTEAA